MSASATRPDTVLGRFRRPDPSTLGIPMMILLAVEFLLGMALNLYVTLGHGSAAAILASSWVLIVHLLVALMLVGISARAVLVAVRDGGRRPLAASALALIASVVATLAGTSFAFGEPSTAASFVMSVGFVGVLLGALFLLIGGRSSASGTPVAGALSGGAGEA